jgi:hypothetical protein
MRAKHGYLKTAVNFIQGVLMKNIRVPVTKDEGTNSERTCSMLTWSCIFLVCQTDDCGKSTSAA